MSLLRNCGLCLLVIFLFTSVTSSQKRRAPKAPAWGVPEVFSNMYLDQETGDVGGMEVILMPSGGQLCAAIEIASGDAERPVLVELSVVKYPNVEFTLPAPYQGYGTFTGKVTQAGMTLSYGAERTFLRRQHTR